MKKLYECNVKYAKNKLWNIRNDIVLNSLYYSDYENRYGYDTHMICDFFDGYLDYINELMKENNQNIHTDYFFHLLPLYDTKENLWNWYCMIERVDF